MRVRMLEDPGVVTLLNEETCPVRIDLTDHGFPRGVPALEIWERELDAVPWFRMGFAHWILLDPTGERILGTMGDRFLANPTPGEFFLSSPFRLRSALDRFATLRELESEPGAASQERLARLTEELERELEQEFLVGFSDRRIQTAVVLMDRGPAPFDDIIRRFQFWDPDSDPTPESAETGTRIAQGMTEAIIHALGDFLVDDSPLSAVASEKMQSLYRIVQGKGSLPGAAEGSTSRAIPDWHGDPPIPPLFRAKAAVALGRVVGLDWRESDPDVIDEARAWWTEHRDDASYRITWTDSRDRYSAFVEKPALHGE